MEDDRNGQHSEYDKENALEIDGEKQLAEEAEAAFAREQKAKHRSEKAALQKEIERLKAELEKAAEEKDAITDRYQRTFSDFNNFKKRKEAEAYQAMKAGEFETLQKMLPVLDSMEKALEHVSAEDESPVAKGIYMVYRQITDIFDALGVKEIPALGEEFDPNLHHAIQQAEPKEGVKPGTVVAVARKGYMQGDRVLRPSMVIVNK